MDYVNRLAPHPDPGIVQRLRLHVGQLLLSGIV
jgi:hypothetical protein